MAEKKPVYKNVSVNKANEYMIALLMVGEKTSDLNMGEIHE